MSEHWYYIGEVGWVRRDKRLAIRVKVWGRGSCGPKSQRLRPLRCRTQPGLNPVPSGLASLHHSRLSTRSSYQLCSFSSNRRVCYDNHRSFVYDSPNLFRGPSGLVWTGLTGVRSEPGPRTHLTSLLCCVCSQYRWLVKFFFIFDAVCALFFSHMFI